MACRICLDEGFSDDNPLVSPCLCRAVVHRKCLSKWRGMSQGNPRSLAYYRCEVCHYEYRFRRVLGATVLGHPATAAFLSTLVIAALSGLLGFVPIIQVGRAVNLQSHLSLHSLILALSPLCTHHPQGILGLPERNVWLHFADGLIVVGLLGSAVMLISWCMGVSGGAGSSPGPDCCYCYGWNCGDCGDCGGGSDNQAFAIVCMVSAHIGYGNKSLWPNPVKRMIIQ